MCKYYGNDHHAVSMSRAYIRRSRFLEKMSCSHDSCSSCSLLCWTRHDSFVVCCSQETFAEAIYFSWSLFSSLLDVEIYFCNVYCRSCDRHRHSEWFLSHLSQLWFFIFVTHSRHKSRAQKPTQIIAKCIKTTRFCSLSLDVILSHAINDDTATKIAIGMIMEFMEIVRYSVDRKCWRCFYERSPTTSYAIMYIWRYRNTVHTAEEVTSFAKCMWHRFVDYDDDDVRHWGFVRVMTLNKWADFQFCFSFICLHDISWWWKTWWCLNVYKSYQHRTPVFDSLSIVLRDSRTKSTTSYRFQTFVRCCCVSCAIATQ